MSEKIFLFSYGDHSFCLPASRILKVLQRPRVFALPLMRERMGGVFFFEEELVPLVRLECFFSPSFNFRQEVCFALVCFSDRGLFGLPCGRVVKIVDSSAGKFESAVSEDRPGIQGTFCVFRQDYTCLDVDRLIEHGP